MTLPSVHAYRDDGPMSLPTKWKPRRVECTKNQNHQDLPGEMFVVKYARGAEGCACAISELVCTQLLKQVGIRTLKPYVVRVSPSFAASCNFKTDFPYSISAGEHFGTLLETDVEDGPPPTINDLRDPWDLVQLWVADTWIGNVDRERNGNILLQHAGNGKFDIIAADQSDCFGGASNLCSQQFTKIYLNRGTASAPKILPTAIAKCGGRPAVAQAITKVESVASILSGVVAGVPAAWLSGAAIQPGMLVNALQTRLSKLTEIVRPSQWEVPNGVLI